MYSNDMVKLQHSTDIYSQITFTYKMVRQCTYSAGHMTLINCNIASIDMLNRSVCR